MGCRFVFLYYGLFLGLLSLWVGDRWWLIDSVQESPIPGAVNSSEGPGWWKVLNEVFHVE